MDLFNKAQGGLPKLNINKKKALIPFDIVYYAIYIYVFSFYFIRTTLIHKQFLQVYEEQFISILRIIGTILFFYSIYTIVVVCDGFKDRLITLGLFIYSLLYLKNREMDVNYRTVSILFQLILCSRNKNSNVLLISSYVIGWIQILLSFVFSIFDIVPSYVYAGTRHGFGSVYPTDLACHILILAIILCVLRKGKLKIYEYIWYAIICVVNYVYMQAKTGLGLLLLLLMITFIYQYLLPKINIPYYWNKVIAIATSASFVVLALVFIILSAIYDDSTDTFFHHFHTFRLRLIYGKRLFDGHQLSLWGEYIKENGFGGVPGPVKDYFFIDISYVRLLFLNGILLLFVVLIYLTYTQIILSRKNMLYICVTLAIFALDCAVEHHLFQTAYSLPLFIIGLSDYVDRVSKPNVRKWKKKGKYISLLPEQ